MKKRTYFMLLVGLSMPAHTLRAAETGPAGDQVDTSGWKYKFCAFEEEGVSGDVEDGVGAVSDDSARFGDYTGLNEEAPFSSARRISVRAARMARIGTLADTTSASIPARSLPTAVRQGKYRLSLDYSELPHYLFDSAMTPFLGDRNLTLPPGGNAYRFDALLLLTDFVRARMANNVHAAAMSRCERHTMRALFLTRPTGMTANGLRARCSGRHRRGTAN